MSSLLPILNSHGAPGTLCSICPDPGKCCRNFLLSRNNGDQLTFWAETWREDAHAELDLRKLPFRIDRIESTSITASFREYVTLRYSCGHLTADGRCGIYEDRPDTCRLYTPGTSDLCAFGELLKS